jgi:hypothetical protein
VGRHDHEALSRRAHPDAMWLTIGSGEARLIRTDSPEQAIPRHPRAPVVENCLSAVVGPPAHFRPTRRMQASSRPRLGDHALFLRTCHRRTPLNAA